MNNPENVEGLNAYLDFSEVAGRKRTEGLHEERNKALVGRE